MSRYDHKIETSLEENEYKNEGTMNEDTLIKIKIKRRMDSCKLKDLKEMKDKKKMMKRKKRLRI